MKIFISVSSFTSEDLIEEIKAKGIEISKNQFGRRMTEDELINQLQEFDGIIAGLEPLNENVLKSLPKLKAISRVGIGVDNIDLKTAQVLNIKVSNTPDAPTKSVAEITIAALLAIAHQIIPSNEDMHHGIWEKRMGRLLEELSILIIGFGRIGRYTASLLEQFGCRIMVYDPYIKEYSETGLVEKLSEADVITLHASGKTEILTPDLFGYIKKGAIILNSSRGNLINEESLYTALNDGTISYFWGDAFWQEPYNGALLKCTNAVLTPHISTNNLTCRKRMESEAVSNLLRDLCVK